MRRLLSVGLCAVLLSGCTIPGFSQPSAGPSTAPTSEPASTASPAGSASAPASASASAPGSVPALAVIASRMTAYDGKKARVDLNELVVTGDVTTLTWTLTNPSDEDEIELVGGVFKDTSIFSDRREALVPGSDDKVEFDLRAADGLSLIDTVNRRRYLAARDSNGVCLCSSSVRYENLAPGASIPYSATYRAIPEGVTEVNIAVPGAGTFLKVPVQR